MKNNLAIIILAAGKGTRMKSAKPKVLHEIGGLPMISHVIRTAEKLKPQKIVVVIGPGMDAVAEVVKPHVVAIQKNIKGTGDAVKAALPGLKNFKGNVLILLGDVPLVPVDTLDVLINISKEGKKSGLCVLGMIADNPTGYGRLIMDSDKEFVERIVEEKDCSSKEREISLCSTGIFLVRGLHLSKWISRIKNNNKQKEYYLTDLPAIAARAGYKTEVLLDADHGEHRFIGVNSRSQLATVEYIFQHMQRKGALENGVTMHDPETVYFSWDTKLANDVTIEPNVVFGPGVSVGEGSVIKSFSHIEGAKIGEHVSIGPFARLRPGTVLEEKARIGNFVEIKKSKIGKGSKIPHLSYVGDTVMGEGTNFSAGAITVNYDGFEKYQTTIGKNVMVGSNVNLIAPVTVNDGAFIAAGSTVTEDVPANALSIGRERPEMRKNWAAEFRKRKAKK